ncbi:MAG: S24 family peptidase [Patescibacteria group bacterium]
MKNEYLKKLESFHETKKRMPTYAEMTKLWGFKSKNAVAKIVEKLLNAGLVAKDHLGRLVPTQTFGEIQMAGLVKAGPPSEVDELSDTVDLDEFLINKKELTYMLEVDGDSMIDAHIEEGDHVLVERVAGNVAKDGDIVIAEVDGEYTMKYLRNKNCTPHLEPANKNYSDIYPEQSFNILGVVKAVMRKY